MTNFQVNGDRLLPPQNIEAEESILGGILLDPEAIGRVTDRLNPEAFSLDSHKVIYRAALTLHNQGKPTDLMSVTSWLHDHSQLAGIGGQSKLATLVDRTVSSVNIDQYADLVMDKYLRRNLIHAGHQIAQLGYETALELETVLDEAEQKVFSITQERQQQGLVPISDTLISTFQHLESRQEGQALPGLICDFYDLDAMTSGFQRSDLIIVAGRPSMGKTSFALNIAQNIATSHKLPVAIFSLEMSKEQLVQRLLASEAKIESNRLRAGRITQNEWEALSRAIGTLSELPIFIDDTPNMTVMQMRSQARRLLAEHRGELGLILLDYLQLMEGGGDNRVQELSRITRSLKGLARELNVPVIALSQLSRGVESRTNKRPLLSDLRESGCLTGDSLVTLADSGVQVPIRELVGKSGFAVWALNEATMKLERAVVSNAFSTGVKPVFRLKTRLGRTIRATGNHKFLTIDGWKRLDELHPGSHLALPRCLPSLYSTFHVSEVHDPTRPIGHPPLTKGRVGEGCTPLTCNPLYVQSLGDTELALLGHLIGDGCTLPRHVMQCTTREEDLAHTVASLAVEVFGSQINPRISKERDWYQVYLCAGYRLTHNVRNPVAKWLDAMGVFGLRAYEKFVPSQVFDQQQAAIAIFLRHLWSSDVYWDEIVSIEADGEAEVYDLTVPGLHNFIANNILVHNSIEQDADLVIMLYRDVYYSPDSPDRSPTGDVAEVIIAKHRNGPTGTIKLLFDPQYTKFKNLAR